MKPPEPNAYVRHPAAVRELIRLHKAHDCPECGGSKAVRLVSHWTGWPIGPAGVCGNVFHQEGTPLPVRMR